MNQSRQISEGEILEHYARQLIQNERWITIGRLIASICHDITNRMQAVQGALSLATEEPALSDDMKAYLSICQQESRRVSLMVERLRYIYHPDSDQMAPVDIVSLLNEVGALTSDAMTNCGLAIEMNLAADLPVIKGRIGQLEFAFLGLLLNLIDLAGPKNGGHIRVEARTIESAVRIEFSMDVPLLLAPNRNEAAANIVESALGLSTFRQVILAQNGDVGISLTDPGLRTWISLPIA